MINRIDALIIQFDKAIRVLSGIPAQTGRTSPSDVVKEVPLSDKQQQESVALMRVNHAGEVAAQALYHGQLITAKGDALKNRLEVAAREEGDHLKWCTQRVEELGGKPSRLNGAWYTGAFIMGFFTGKMGDKWSLGFIAETESQVVRHLQSHLKQLGERDKKSQAIILMMCDDEAAHQDNAITAGGQPLPFFIRSLMAFNGKIMTSLSYYW